MEIRVMQNSILENNVLKLRALEPSDLDILYKWENNTENWLISSTVVPFSKAVLEQFIKNSHEDIYTSKQLRLIIVDKVRDKVVGAIDLFDFDPINKRAGVGILIDAQERGKGFGYMALEQFKAYCFQFLQLHQLYADILTTNTASVALFAKCEFNNCGCKKEWILSPYGWLDELSFQCVKK